MALLDFSLADPPASHLSEGPVYLRFPRKDDFDAWADLRMRSREFLQPWEPAWVEDELSITSYRRRLRFYAREVRTDMARPFFVFRARDDQLVGGCVLSNIRRGVAQIGTLGYWTGEPFINQGYASCAVRAVIRAAFHDLGLQRLEAATLPENIASQKLLRKANFREEGYARQYLQIAGERQDHVLFGLLKAEQ